MDNNLSDGYAIMIVGPTAVGKTDLAIYLAEQINGEIVSVDSRYLYRGMDIGTAKPPKEILLKIPHHLVNVANPDEVWSLAKVLEEVNNAISMIHRRERIPILVGGTGQYYRAIVRGWTPPAIAPDPILRERLYRWLINYSPNDLKRMISRIDPQLAEEIDVHNTRRVVRAFEVMFKSGQKFSALRSFQKPHYQFCVIGVNLPRELLYQKADERIENMIQNGFIEEVRLLKEAGYSKDLPSFSAIGYRELMDVIDGEITLSEAVMIMKRKTRTLIRRQSNWFRISDPEIHWFNVSNGYQIQVKNFVTHWLENNAFIHK
ncbi:MAG: tRNA (adenosine(37)-N6)-dimethylallyltransferase MiaA [Anaerolineales bacterium]